MPAEKKSGIEEFLLNREIVKCYFIGVVLLTLLAVLVIVFTTIAIPSVFDLPVTVMSPCNAIVPNQCTVAGRQYVDGSCALPCPDGYNHSSLCSCTRGSTIVSCDVYAKLQSLPTTCSYGRQFYGTTCVLTCPNFWRRTGACTCETGEVVTDCTKYGAGGTLPKRCPIDREYVDGMCWRKCPPGFTRVPGLPCTCQFGEIITDCTTYGVPSLPTVCPASRDYYLSTCLNPCPPGSQRTSACGCTFGEIISDCNAFGLAQLYQCEAGTQQQLSSLCYNACPYGGQRTGICSCRFNNLPDEVCQIPQTICPSDYPLNSPTCNNMCGLRTDCALLSGGTSVSKSPGCSNPSYPAYSTESLCYQFACPASGQRSGLYECVYPGSIDRVNGNSGCTSARPLGPFGTCPGPDCWCYAYSGTLEFIGYTPFYGGNSIASTDICPSTHPNEVGSLCFQYFCPVNNLGEIGTRTAACSCVWGSCSPGSTGQISTCNGSYPIFSGGLCCSTNGEVTSCESLNGGAGALPSSCPEGTEDTGGGCYRSCPAGFCRSALCTCSNRRDVIDCSLYGNPKAVGDQLGPMCQSSQDMWGLACYSGKCPEGYTRTGSCSCSNHQLVTNCTLYGDPKGVGDPEGPQCELDEEYFGGVCYKQSCAASQMRRIGACSCSNLQVITNCTEFGDPRAVGQVDGPACTMGEDYFAGVCYREQCPLPMVRTGACSCSDFDIKTDCKLYGDNKYPGDPSGLGPTCPPNYDFTDLLCYNPPCPAGRTRVAACSCQKDTPTNL